MSTTTVHPFVLRASSITVSTVEFVVEAVVAFLELAFVLILDVVNLTCSGINEFFTWLDKRAARNQEIRERRKEFAWRAKTTAKAQAKYGPRRDGVGIFGAIRLFLFWSVMAYVTFHFVLPAFQG